MAKYTKRSERKSSGGKYRPLRKKRKHEVVSDSPPTKLGRRKLKKNKVRGSNEKNSLLFAKFANLMTKKGAKKVEILDVVENKSNRHFVREDIITKGAIIKTEEGLAKVTSRPGQSGIVNAQLIEE